MRSTYRAGYPDWVAAMLSPFPISSGIPNESSFTLAFLLVTRVDYVTVDQSNTCINVMLPGRT